MEFTFKHYSIRLLLNPNDFILRAEHNIEKRIYERTFFERDFTEFLGFGGLEFVEKLVQSAFTCEDTSIQCVLGKETTSELSLQLQYSLLTKTTLKCTLTLPAIRKEKGASDIHDLERHVKKLAESVTSMKSTIETMTHTIHMLEEISSGCVVIPGVRQSISRESTTLILIKDNTMMPNGYIYSSWYPYGRIHQNQSWNPTAPAGATGANWQIQSGDTTGYTFTTMKSLSNLKYLTSLTYLCISGANELTDYSYLKHLVNLTKLEIVSSRSGSDGSQSGGNNPQLTDIQWIVFLTKLKSVSFLGCNRLTDITPLKDLPNLEELNIRETAVKNTDFLTNSSLKITK